MNCLGSDEGQRPRSAATQVVSTTNEKNNRTYFLVV